MAEEKEMEMQDEVNKKVKVQVGDVVQIKRGLKKGDQGKVTVVRNNSVIVELGMNPKTNEPIKTVVNHKNYKKVKG